MITATKAHVDNSPTGLDPDICHYVCICDRTVSICGADLTHAEYTPDAPEEEECVVCIEMDQRPCERCGL